MDISYQFFLLNQFGQRTFFKYGRVAFNQIKQFRLKNHKTNINKVTIHVGFLPECINHTVSANFHNALVLSEVVHRHRADFPMCFMELHQFFNIDVTHCITIGEHKRLVSNIVPNPLHSPTGLGIQTSIHHRDLPRLSMFIVDNHFVAAIRVIKGDIRSM